MRRGEGARRRRGGRRGYRPARSLSRSRARAALAAPPGPPAYAPAHTSSAPSHAAVLWRLSLGARAEKVCPPPACTHSPACIASQQRSHTTNLAAPPAPAAQSSHAYRYSPFKS